MSYRNKKQETTEIGLVDPNQCSLVTSSISRKHLKFVPMQATQLWALFCLKITRDKNTPWPSSLTKAETKYSTREKELVAIEKLRSYLYEKRFVVYSDHKPLVWMENMVERSPKIARWKEALRGYDFVIRYRTGKANIVADYLSRPMQVNLTQSDSEEPWGFELLPEPTVIVPPEQPSNDNSEQTEERPYRGPNATDDIVNRYKHQLWWRTSTDGTIRTTDLAARIWTAYETNFDTIRAELVQCEKAVESVRGEQERYDIVKSYHRGIADTMGKLSRHYYWPNMKETIENVVGKCEVCNEAKYLRNPPQVPQITPTPGRPFEMVHMDLFFEGR
ncbi:hypothetical protein AAG570_012501 [Ranatra chinensis]|uniref:RNA-directed DNA polymerase n=1 Tax=Ranatra chinensis TaxID=642074 RepID=A0ABD0YE16_9HEMI